MKTCDLCDRNDKDCFDLQVETVTIGVTDPNDCSAPYTAELCLGCADIVNQHIREMLTKTFEIPVRTEEIDDD